MLPHCPRQRQRKRWMRPRNPLAGKARVRGNLARRPTRIRRRGSGGDLRRSRGKMRSGCSTMPEAERRSARKWQPTGGMGSSLRPRRTGDMKRHLNIRRDFLRNVALIPFMLLLLFVPFSAHGEAGISLDLSLGRDQVYVGENVEAMVTL